MESDTKIFREVNALSGLSRRDTIPPGSVETFEPTSAAHSEDSSTAEGGDGMTSRYRQREAPPFQRQAPPNIDDLSVSRPLFPSIHSG